MGVSAPVAGGRVQGGRGLVADVTLRAAGSRDVRREAGRVARGHEVLGSPVVTGRSPVMLGRPAATGSPAVLGSLVMLGRPAVTGSLVMLASPAVTGGLVTLVRPAVTGSPVVMGPGRGSGALGAA